jgi:hypothetical protein
MSKPRQKSTKPLFGEAPPRDLAFPSEDEEQRAIPVTAVELLVFCPNWARTLPVAFRLASNDCTNSVAVKIINHHRIPSDKGEVMKNTFCTIMLNAFRSGGVFMYLIMEKGVPKMKKWTSTHHRQFNTKDHYGVWNHGKLTLAGYKHDGRSSNEVVKNVRFESLAINLKRFPSMEFGDGLNLTRCVQYALEHPEEDLMFPKDFAYLANRLDVYPIRDKHYDQATFARWRDTTPYPSHNEILRPLGSHRLSPSASVSSVAVPRSQAYMDLPNQAPRQQPSSQHLGPALPASEIVVFTQNDWIPRSQEARSQASLTSPDRPMSRYTPRIRPRSRHYPQSATTTNNPGSFDGHFEETDDWSTPISPQFEDYHDRLAQDSSPYSRPHARAGVQQHQQSVNASNNYPGFIFSYPLPPIAQARSPFSHTQPTNAYNPPLGAASAVDPPGLWTGSQPPWPASDNDMPSSLAHMPQGLPAVFDESLLGFTPPPLDPSLTDDTAGSISPEHLPPGFSRNYQ